MADPTRPARAGRELEQHVLRSRYAANLAAQADAVITDAFREIARMVRESGNLTRLQRQEVARLMGRVRGVLDQAYGATRLTLEKELAVFAELEATVTRQTVRDLLTDVGLDPRVTMSGLSRVSLQAIAALPVEGHTLGQWYAGQMAAMTERVRRQVQVGLTLGEGPATIAQRVVNAGDAPSVSAAARQQARTIARTAVAAVQTHAAVETYRANADLVEGVQLQPVIDGRTSLICLSLDVERVWAIDDPRRPQPPLHLGCRTVVVPVLDWAGLGLSPPGDTGPLAMKDYGAWLTTQSETEQNRILGRTRAAAWRAGRVTLQELVGGDLRPLTLAQLGARYDLTILP